MPAWFMAWKAWRPVESQPPPGLAGSITLTCACAAPAHIAVAMARNFNKRVIFIAVSSNLSDGQSPCNTGAKSKPLPMNCQCALPLRTGKDHAEQLHGRVRIQHIQVMAEAVIVIDDIGGHLVTAVSVNI